MKIKRGDNHHPSLPWLFSAPCCSSIRFRHRRLSATCASGFKRKHNCAAASHENQEEANRSAQTTAWCPGQRHE